MKLWLWEHNQVMGDLRKEFEIAEKIEDADKVLLWNDVNPIERGIVRYARSLKKPVFVLQHGRKGTSRYYPPFSEKIQADKLFVWGEFDRASLIEAGQEARIEVVGSPIFSRLYKKAHEGINVVFSPEHWDRAITENTLVRKKLRQLRGIQVITKLIDSPSHDPKAYDNVVLSNRAMDNHLDVCADVLSVADIVVGISESTFELMAQFLNIPVVIMDEWSPKSFGGDARYATYRRVISRAAKRTSLKNLLKTIKHQLENPDELEEERKQVCIEEGGSNLNFMQRIHEVLA